MFVGLVGLGVWATWRLSRSIISPSLTPKSMAEYLGLQVESGYADQAKLTLTLTGEHFRSMEEFWAMRAQRDQRKQQETEQALLDNLNKSIT